MVKLRNVPIQKHTKALSLQKYALTFNIFFAVSGLDVTT